MGSPRFKGPKMMDLLPRRRRCWMVFVHVVYRHLVSICSHLQVQAAVMAASLQSSAHQAS